MCLRRGRDTKRGDLGDCGVESNEARIKFTDRGFITFNQVQRIRCDIVLHCLQIQPHE